MSENNISVYPNPATDNITVEMNVTVKDKFEMEITDMLGKQVKLLLPQTIISEGVFKKSFDISKLQSGFYNYHIKSNTVNHSGIISKN